VFLWLVSLPAGIEPATTP